ncbi:hypothetical protein RALTA_B0957 [Cupriavidus taiwanensis LMG 19424]|uniref:Uncharacterized protein n=1 Tax=Cupriavidus taiwanensis (strain DSM 17343 / BCRC 17206 / CCUG 44338 / CIP 107171 / LMG 19424 / R1) TaxID=977880 RepID=B3R9J3_CUPTR|nr:hypothetical protein RALTA_B0957 [Cupriavidus taiwanensis LMG 19424]
MKTHHPDFFEECMEEWRGRGKERPTDVLGHIIEKAGFRNRLAGEGYSRYYEALWLWI